MGDLGDGKAIGTPLWLAARGRMGVTQIRLAILVRCAAEAVVNCNTQTFVWNIHHGYCTGAAVIQAMKVRKKVMRGFGQIALR